MNHPIANTITVGPRHFPVSPHNLPLTLKSCTILTIFPVAKVTPTPGTAPTAPPSSRRSPTVCLSKPYLSRWFTDSPHRRHYRWSHQHHRPQEVDLKSLALTIREVRSSQVGERKMLSVVMGREGLRVSFEWRHWLPGDEGFDSWYIASV